MCYHYFMEIYKGAQTRYQIGYHVVWGVKYHKQLLNNTMKKFLAETIKEICTCYDFYFMCIGIAPNHIHLFAGAPPKIAPAKMVQVIKSISAREMFKNFPQIKKQLWGGEIWKDGYYVGTVGEGQTEAIITEYLKKQDQEECEIERAKYLKQLKLFH